MYLVFEYLFYLGLIATVVGLLILLTSLVGGHWSRLKYGGLAILFGVAIIVGPAYYSRMQVIDLGPRQVLVNGEKHITLTGWDGQDYAVLQGHPETIVLQIANPDVTDQTTEYLADMANLRELDLNDSQITDAGLANIAKLTGLQTLRLRGTQITDVGMHEHLSRLPNLQRLDLRQTAVTAEAIELWKSNGEGRRAFSLMTNTTTDLKLDAAIDHARSHAQYLATACDLAYLPADQGRQRFADQLRLDAELVSVDNTQAYVGQNNESIVIAFRGSQSPNSLDGVKDWLLTNARNFLVLPEGRIGTDFAAAGVGARFHRGFMQALDEIWLPLFESVDQKFTHQERPVWVTGHSLGGALALLCAWRMHQQFIPIHQVCTFGAPMIGNLAAAEAFAREFPGKIFRYVDVGDLVPRLPMISLLSNDYDHCQKEIVCRWRPADDCRQTDFPTLQHRPRKESLTQAWPTWFGVKFAKVCRPI